MTSSTQLGLDALFATAAQHGRDLERLVPLARECAALYGSVTVSDVRCLAVARGLLTGQERGRSLSFLGALMRRAGLVPTDEYRRSDIPQSHGNLERVWRGAP